jgi:hypothetical protein
MEFLEGNQKYYYTSINVGGKIENKINKDNRYYFMISPYLSYWLAGKAYQLDKKTGEEVEINIEFSGEYTDGTKFEYNRWDAGITLATGIKHKFSGRRFGFLDIRYEFGMIHSGKENVDGTFNRVFSINLGYLFTL